MRVQSSESHRACGDPACLHPQLSLPGCKTRWHWWGSGEPLCKGLACTPARTKFLGSPCRRVANPSLRSHLPNSGGLAVVGDESQDTAANCSSQPNVLCVSLPGDPKMWQLGCLLPRQRLSGWVGGPSGGHHPAWGGLQKDIPQLRAVPECHKDKCWKANTQPSKRQQ